ENSKMLEVRDIFKTYENKPLLRGISFSVAQGETICLLGASGSGKSTLLRMIAGLEFPESGHFLFNQIDLAQTPPHLRDFGLVFQDYGLFPHLNIFDNVAFGLKMRNAPTEAIKPRVSEMLELVNLTGFETRRVTDLSGGEQQRVALARALAPSPRLLMFDEPLGALDKSLKDDLLKQIRNILHQTKIPAIYVTHDQDEAFTIADRILLLHDGEIICDGAPSEVWNHPNSVHAARMLGVGNVIEGKIQKADGTKWKVESGISMFEVACKHDHSAGETISLLIRQSGEGEEIKLTVEDVLFDRDQFQVKTRGGLVIHMKDAPRVGENIRVRVKVECLA
ncbi:MAG TPA: ABC transporter ATP-binding protein, partial [Anaerolineales bacterium]|nr:ABC transporter ATP-binding protein [Anaerolineales bacterium]